LSNWLPLVNRLSGLLFQLFLALLKLLLQLLHLVLSLFKLIFSIVDGFVVDSSVSSLLFFYSPKLLFQSPEFLLKLLRALFGFPSRLLEELLELGLDKLLLLQFSLEVLLVVLRDISTRVFFVVDELVVVISINEVRPPVESDGVVAVGYNLWLWTQIWKLQVFLKEAVNVLEANQT